MSVAAVTKTTSCYNSTGLKENGSKADIAKGFKLWIDKVDPTDVDLSDIQKEFNLDINAFNLINQKVKRPQKRILDNYLFTIILDIQYKTQTINYRRNLHVCRKGLVNNYPFFQY